VLVAAAVIVLVIILSIALGGSKGGHTTPATTPAGTSTPTTASTPALSTGSTGTTGGTGSTGTTGTTGQAKIVAQVNLKPPSGASTPAGIAEVLKAGSNEALAILAQHLPPNKHDAYAVWLYNSSTDAKLLGFVSPPVSSNGQLRTEGGLPSNAAHYRQLIITLETSGTPKTPGRIILQGALKGLS
jgi:hypothetical protein